MLARKMVTGGRKRTHFSLDIKFKTEEDKEAFITRLESIRDLMTPSGSAPLENNALIYALIWPKITGLLVSHPRTIEPLGLFQNIQVCF